MAESRTRLTMNMPSCRACAARLPAGQSMMRAFNRSVKWIRSGAGGAGRGGRAGFTLIETLVALAVGGVVLLTGFTALATVRERSRHAVEASTEVLEGAMARATIIDWIAGALPQSQELSASFGGLDAAEYGLPTDELVFPTRASIQYDAPTTAVRLFVDLDPETPERGLVAELRYALDDQPTRLELVPNVTGMSIRYLPDVPGEVEWTDSWIGQPGLPRAVELRLESAVMDSLPPLLRLPMLIPLATPR